MKPTKNRLLPASLIALVASFGLTVWLDIRYRQAETAFANSLNGVIPLSSSGHVLKRGLTEQQIANQRLNLFLVSAAITVLLACFLMVLIYKQRRSRMRSFNVGEQADE